MKQSRKFIVLKGVQGWGDRTQCLLQAIRYARSTGRTLVIDWRDTDWTHLPERDISYWFSVKGINTWPLDKFLKYWKKRGSKLSIIPESWRECMADVNYQHWVYDARYHLPNEQRDLEEIHNGREDYQQDVVVYPGVRYRTFEFSDLGSIELSDHVKKKIQKDLQDLKLYDRNYDVVHLRGGSKSWAGGKVPLESLNQEIHERYPTQNSYFITLMSQYMQVREQLPERELIILTDHKLLGSEWLSQMKVGRMLPTNNEYFAESGTHKLTPKHLKQIEISKDDLVYETLRDFCIMLNARSLFSDGISVFSKLARGCALAEVSWVSVPNPNPETDSETNQGSKTNQGSQTNQGSKTN